MPVLYAVGEMSQTMRARGEEVTVEVWGPGEGGGWQSAAAEASSRLLRACCSGGS